MAWRRAAFPPFRKRSPGRWWRISPIGRRGHQSDRGVAGADLRVVPIELDRPTRDFTQSRQRWTSTSISPPSTSDIGPCPPDCDLLCGRRNGDRQHHDGGGAARGTAWRRRRPLGRPRHRRRRCGPCAQARSNRGGARFSSRASSAIRFASAAALGGRELAAIAGAVLAARRHRIPVLLDGFVATAAVVPLTRLAAGTSGSLPARDTSPPNPATARCCANSASTRCSISTCGSAKPRARRLAILLLRAALACHAGMATFAEAGVSGAGK